MGNERMGGEYEKVYALKSLREICSYIQLIDTKKSNSTKTKLSPTSSLHSPHLFGCHLTITRDKLSPVFLSRFQGPHK